MSTCQVEMTAIVETHSDACMARMSIYKIWVCRINLQRMRVLVHWVNTFFQTKCRYRADCFVTINGIGLLLICID